MPTNITQNDTVEFTVEYVTSSGALTIPSSGALFVEYTTLAGSTALDAINLTQDGSFFVGTWGSSVSRLGPALYTVTAPGMATTPASSGELRIIG
jgi:hypothetical protein